MTRNSSPLGGRRASKPPPDRGGVDPLKIITSSTRSPAALPRAAGLARFLSPQLKLSDIVASPQLKACKGPARCNRQLARAQLRLHVVAERALHVHEFSLDVQSRPRNTYKNPLARLDSEYLPPAMRARATLHS